MKTKITISLSEEQMHTLDLVKKEYDLKDCKSALTFVLDKIGARITGESDSNSLVDWHKSIPNGNVVRLPQELVVALRSALNAMKTAGLSANMTEVHRSNIDKYLTATSLVACGDIGIIKSATGSDSYLSILGNIRDLKVRINNRGGIGKGRGGGSGGYGCD